MIKEGQYYGFEVKRPYVGKLSEVQKSTIAKLRASGAKIYVVTYVSEIKEALNSKADEE
jgi:hypothetical protein